MTKITECGYTCAKPWPENCFVQSGDRGVVFRPAEKGGSYRTAFFEAFPKVPECFIRGEGETVEDAEADAYATFERYLACEHHFERLNPDGRGRCTECGLAIDNALPILHRCRVCETEGAAFESPFNSFVDEKSERVCLTCLNEEVIPSYLATPAGDLAPATLEEDREQATCWYGERFEDLVACTLIPRLMNSPAFCELPAPEQAKKLEQLTSLAFRNLIRPKMTIVGSLKEMGSPGLQFLDDGAYLEACCCNDMGLVTLFGDISMVLWERDHGEFEGDAKAALATLNERFAQTLVLTIVQYLKDCVDNPPKSERRRIPTSDEFKESLTAIAKALATSADPDDEEE